MADRDSWDARQWIAEVLGCDRDDLWIVVRRDGPETRVSYGRGGSQVARLNVAGPLRPPDGTAGGHWEIILQLMTDQSVHRPVSPVSDSTEIAF